MDTRLKDVIVLKGAEDNVLPPAVEVDWAKGKLKPLTRGNAKGRIAIDLKAGVTANDVDEMFHQIVSETRGDRQAYLQLMAQTIVEPILQIVPYAEMYTPIFFMDQGYGDLDDNAIDDLCLCGWTIYGDYYIRIGEVLP
jgi:hypothetical protein